MTSTNDLKQKFWKSLADSPFVFLELDADPKTAVPMTAQLDKDANSAIWFFTSKNHTFASGGPATATFAGKGHDMFARFSGTLTEERSRERFEDLWAKPVEAWFPGGKDDPNILLLRMDLGQAELWNSDLGFVDNAKMLMGFNVREDAREEHTDTVL